MYSLANNNTVNGTLYNLLLLRQYNYLIILTTLLVYIRYNNDMNDM